MDRKFKDTAGRWITTGLFKETAQQDTFILYSLDEARDYFIECNDPTGYDFANKYLGGYLHFLALMDSPTLAPHVNAWQEILSVKIRSKAIKDIIHIAKSDKGYQAAKYLAEEGWRLKNPGRPRKEDIRRREKMDAALYDEFRTDLPNTQRH